MAAHILAKIAQKLPYIKKLHTELDRLRKEEKKLRAELQVLRRNSLYPPGHYYSPIVDIEGLKSDDTFLANPSHADTIAGVELNLNEQVKLIKEFEAFYHEIPFNEKKADPLRFYFDNEYYSYTDAIVLYSVIRHFSPKQIIEVGSGFSSAVMLDTRSLFAPSLNLTFVEPYPERLYSLIKDEDRNACTIITQPVQKVPLEQFAILNKNDILFIDSSHVSKAGSDLNYLLFEVIPSLKPGVLIHFHDVFFPFEYPQEWIYEGRNWNEDYLIRAFLMHNDRFKIRIFSHYLHLKASEAFTHLPLCYKNAGGNLWIEKVK